MGSHSKVSPTIAPGWIVTDPPKIRGPILSVSGRDAQIVGIGLIPIDQILGTRQPATKPKVKKKRRYYY